MKILVTGCFGFIGSHFVRHLQGKDVQVVGVGRLSNQNAMAMSVVERPAEVKLIYRDIAQDCSGLLEGIDVVVNFAAKTFVDHSIKDPDPFIKSNIIGTYNLLEQARLYEPSLFVQVSTDEVYGSIAEGAYKEDARLNPTNPYAATKAAADMLVVSYGNTYGLPYIITRTENNYGCYSSDTEILTQDGFVSFPELKDGAAVATLNPNTLAMEYHVPTARQSFDYSGNLIRFKARQIDLLVTPNHRMFINSRDGKDWWIEDAESLMRRYKPNTIRFKLAADTWNGVTPKTVKPFKKMKQQRLPGYTKGFTTKMETDEWWEFQTKDWCEFMGWYLSEGSTEANMGTRAGGGLKVSIRQTQKHYRQEIMEVVTRLGFYAKEVDDPKEGRVLIYSKELGQYLRQFGKSRQKYVPKDIKAMGKDALWWFLQAYGKGDGSFAGPWAKWKRRVGKLIVICTVSDQMASDIQEIGCKLGAATTKGRQHDNINFVNFAWISTMPRLRQDNAITEVPYGGKVHCVTVQNGVVFVRRNGKVAWCGNSYQNPQKVFPTFVKKALAGEKLPVYGDGKHRRMWLRVEDHCAAIWHLIDSFMHPKTLAGEVHEGIYHVAGEQELENLELAKVILCILGKPQDQIEFIPDHDIRPGHDRRYALDVTKLKASGWKPKWRLHDGIEDAVKWYRDNVWWLK